MVFALGNKFDVAVSFVPTDVVAGTVTGIRVHLRNYAQATLVLVGAAGSTDIPDPALQQHTAASGGTSANLAIITQYFIKDATTLAGTEQWAKTTQAAATNITDAGSASKQQLVALEVDASQLSDGYEWISCNIPDAGSNGTKFVAGLWILHGLRYARSPELLPAVNT